MKAVTVSVLLATALLVSGCAIHQTVEPFTGAADRHICVVVNPQVRDSFTTSLTHALTTKGYEVRQLPPTAALNECPVTITYTANWHWDLAMYMDYAEITVYLNAKPSGKAVYDSKHGGANMNKFIEADKKIGELTNQLFPGGAGS